MHSLSSSNLGVLASWRSLSLCRDFHIACIRTNRPRSHEIPVPPITTSLGTMPGVSELPVRKELPDAMVMNDGTKVSSPAQWEKRREEMKRILEYYAVGLAPPPPGNVKGQEIKTEMLLDGKVKYRLVHLTFGPKESLSLDVGIFTPVQGGPFPAVIMPGGTPPGHNGAAEVAAGAGAGKGFGCVARGWPGDAIGRSERSPRRVWRPERHRNDRRPKSRTGARIRLRHLQQQRLRRRHHASQRRR